MWFDGILNLKIPLLFNGTLFQGFVNIDIEREKKLCIKSFCSVSYPSLCNFVTVLVKKFLKFRDFQPKIVKSRKNYRHNLQNYDV